MTKIYPSVALSTTITVQDAADYQRNLETLSSTTIGVALKEMLEGTPYQKCVLYIVAAMVVTFYGAEHTKLIDGIAASVLEKFSSF